MSHFVHKQERLRSLFTQRIVIISLLLMLCGTVSAYTYYRPSDSPYGNPTNGLAIPPGSQLPSYQITSTSSITMGSGYAPGMISPFSNGNPSDNSNGGSGGNNNDIPDDVPNLNDPWDDSTQSPVGESWILLIFAAIAAGVIFIQQRKKQNAKA